jgi:hypothetical protein
MKSRNSLLAVGLAAATLFWSPAKLLAGCLVYDIRGSSSARGFQDYVNGDFNRPKFGSARVIRNSIFLIGPEEIVTEQGQDGPLKFGRHSMLTFSLSTTRSPNGTIRSYVPVFRPVMAGNKYTGLDLQVFALDARKSEVIVRFVAIEDQNLYELIGKGKFAKPVPKAAAPVWFAQTLKGNVSGIFPEYSKYQFSGEYFSVTSLQSEELYFGTSVRGTVIAKMNKNLTDMVYNMDFESARKAIEDDLKSKGFTSGSSID